VAASTAVAAGGRQEKAPARTGALAMLWFHVARDLPAIGG